MPDGSQKTMKRRLGKAWLEPDGEGGYRKKRGRVKAGFLDEQAAIVAKDQLIREVEQDLVDDEEARARELNTAPTFRVLAGAYLDWLERVRDAKPSTLQDHGYLLAEPGTPYKRGKGTHPGHMMRTFGNKPADEIHTRDVNRFLDRIAAAGVSPRTVNKHRQLISAIYGYGCQEATYGLPRNPAQAADRRQEPEPARLEFYSPEEIEALARSLDEGRHRNADAPAVNDEEKLAQQAEDRQDAELVRVAAYAGLRRGELVALRWRHVDFAKRKIVVQRAVSANVDATSTKSRKAREVPLPDQASGALDRLSQRDDFIGPEDYVFVNRLGRRLDASALRRRVSRAREAAQLRELRFHDLRHTYGSLLVAGGIDLASVKAAMGHARLSTTERYLHARSATDLADKFTQALRGTESSANRDGVGSSVPAN
ncbi:site-specific integrase [Paraconexibacter antarcticus]|uniref:Site-specific integrase n=1 Tax=Paraconexibacter antarcticus TaxID=2949664 RepID=A0ABY5DSS8_9ACTN|nr:site-specific integrase [Paraconexibacter antarcticus]UTI64303.1 site-specific integrase [Paraconexibacter antarcticus]